MHDDDERLLRATTLLKLACTQLAGTVRRTHRDTLMVQVKRKPWEALTLALNALKATDMNEDDGQAYLDEMGKDAASASAHATFEAHRKRVDAVEQDVKFQATTTRDLIDATHDVIFAAAVDHRGEIVIEQHGGPTLRDVQDSLRVARDTLGKARGNAKVKYHAAQRAQAELSMADVEVHEAQEAFNALEQQYKDMLP